MKFASPQNLWFLAMLPLLAAYAWRAVRRPLPPVPDGRLIREALANARGPRFFPPLLLALALAALLAALGRPTAFLTLPTAEQTVILAIDISGSMQAQDVEPTRLGAAQAAAREFAEALPERARIGIVAFTDTAQLILKPTSSRDAVMTALETLTAQQGTAIGSAIIASLEALFPDASFDLDHDLDLDGNASTGAGGPASKTASERSSAIVLLTDGQNTDGPEPLKAGGLAAKLGVPVYTVGVGTVHGHIQRGVAWTTPVGIDEGMLKSIAATTGAEYFYAESSPDLRKIYSDLGTRLVLGRRELEVTALFCAFGALGLVLSAGLSLLWYGRIA